MSVPVIKPSVFIRSELPLTTRTFDFAHAAGSPLGEISRPGGLSPPGRIMAALLRATHPWQRFEVHIAAGENDANPLLSYVGFSFLNRRIRNSR